jgi:hypothetical protein
VNTENEHVVYLPRATVWGGGVRYLPLLDFEQEITTEKKENTHNINIKN